MTPIQAYAGMILLLMAGAFIALFLGRRQRFAGAFAFAVVLVSALVLGWVVLQVYQHGPVEARESFFWVIGFSEFKGEAACMTCHSSSRALFSVPGFGASLVLRIDHLSAF
ncbi:MAG TPA: hypothetical protein VLH58_08260, partial [Candidatus Methylomirabilis sp.]|nr:hypothetical protein [Candidatus Methylomirabilis sp.]